MLWRKTLIDQLINNRHMVVHQYLNATMTRNKLNHIFARNLLIFHEAAQPEIN